jgi:Tfp pilus assembly protein PilF
MKRSTPWPSQTLSSLRRRPVRILGAAVLLVVPGACAFCIENVTPPQAIEHTAFAAEYFAQGKLTEAEARCRLAIEFCPKCAEPWNLLGMIEHARGHLDRATDNFKNALSLKNDFPEALNNLGAIFLEQRDYGAAADAFKQALEIDPGYQTARRNYATCLMYTGETEHARAEYLKCVEIDPGECDCRIGLGILSIEKEDWNDAKAHFQKVTETCPSSAQGFHNLCWTYFKLGRCSDAVDSCTKAIAIDPEYLEARKNLTEAYECLALQDGAVKKIIDELRDNPGDPELHFRLGRIYEDGQLWERALNEYQNAVKLDAKYLPAYFRAARVLDRMLRAEETIQMCQQFIDLVRDPKYDKDKAWCISRIKELQFQ